MALEVSEALIRDAVDLTPAKRSVALVKYGEDALAASDAARHASLVLTGDEIPETKAFFEVTRL